MKSFTEQPSPLLGAVLAALIAVAGCGTPKPSSDADSLHALARDGYALLENEDPAAAVEVFTTLRERLADDPLAHGNLALALLRSEQAEQASAAVDAGLERFPDNPDLLAIRATIQQWLGEVEEALDTIRRAAELAPEDPEIQFNLYRTADQIGAEDTRVAVDRLSRLRPENLVVLLVLGKHALAGAERDPEAARTTASGAYLRVRELAWDNPDALQIVEQLLQALADNRLQDTRTPAIQVENLLKITPAYKQSLRELETGIQGIPLRYLSVLTEPAPIAEPATLTFSVQPTDQERLTGVTAAFVADLDNDGTVDAIRTGADGVEIVLGTDSGLDIWQDSGVEVAPAHDAVALDYDIDGDLDLAVATERGVRLFRNALDGPLTEVTEHAGGLASELPVSVLHATDLDLDGDLDLVGIEGSRLVLWPNLRQGEFGRRELATTEGNALVSGDLDHDGRFELAVGGTDAVRIFKLEGDAATVWAELAISGTVEALAIGDVDADGRLDLLAAGSAGVTLWQNTGDGFAEPVVIFDQLSHDLTLVDDDSDCDLDILVSGPTGLSRLETQSEAGYHCLRLRLRGLDQGSSKNNVLGLGSLVEVSVGGRTMTAEVQAEETFFGLGDAATADLLRVVWTNGVPQNRFDVDGDATVVEEQLLKGSCPFLYAWDGERFEFVTDLLWGSPAGLPVAPGVWAGADPSELVHIPQAVVEDGRLDLRVTEELWEAAFFDHLRLWVVEVDEDLEVASSIKILPGRPTPETVHATAEVQPMVNARDAQGRDVTAIVADRDEVYADGWSASRYQGVPAEPWTLEFDLGEPPGKPVRLLLDGWIFPADASLNLAVAQRDDLAVHSPRIEVLDRGDWRTLAENVGFPAGKTKTMVVDLPPLPEGASRLRLVAAQWLSFDRIAWSTRPADDAVRVAAQLPPEIAELRYRGYSRLLRKAPNAPHSFDYHVTESRHPWLPFPGRYTRYGDVRELLATADDRSVILAAGDEMRLVFDLDLPAAAPGKRYEYFLESHGWDKDADRNTYEAAQVEPLPFRAMSGYPFAPGEHFPDTPATRAYKEEWLTREVVGSRSQ